MLIEISATILENMFAQEQTFGAAIFKNPTESNPEGMLIKAYCEKFAQTLGLSLVMGRKGNIETFDTKLKNCRLIGIKSSDYTLHQIYNIHSKSRIQYHITEGAFCIGLPLLKNVDRLSTYDGKHLLNIPNRSTNSKLFDAKVAENFLANYHNPINADNFIQDVWWEAFEVFIKGKKTDNYNKSYLANNVIGTYQKVSTGCFAPRFMEKAEILRVVMNSNLPPKEVLLTNSIISFAFVWFIKLELAKLASKPGVQYITQR